MRLAIETVLPESFHNASPNGWSMTRRRQAECSCFLEGPCFDRDGTLWCVDIANGRLLNWKRDSGWSVALDYDGWPNGLKVGADGLVYVADNRLGVLQYDPSNGKTETLLDRFEDQPLLGPNDLTISRTGDIYFSDQGDSDLTRPYGRVIRIGRNGTVDLIAARLPSPNGIVLSRNENLLYVAMTQANAIWRVALGSDGEPGKVGHFVQLSGSHGGGPDGLAIDEEDRLLVCHALASRVLLFDHVGNPAGVIETERGAIPTNLAFGWPDGNRLYVTEAETGTIQSVELETPGWLKHLQSPKTTDVRYGG